MVSIVTATKNAEKYIAQQLLSIQNQTYTDFECIIVDDHSTDSTVSIVERQFCKRDPRFKLLVGATDPNNPYADAHNKIFQLAAGEYTIHVDQDDVCTNYMVEDFVTFLDEHDDCDAVCGRIGNLVYDHVDSMWKKRAIQYERTVPKDDARIAHNPSSSEDDQFIKSPAKAYVSLCNLWTNQCFCIRTKVMKRLLNEGLRFYWQPYSDYLFWLNAMRLGCRMKKIKKVMLYWRNNQNSLSHTKMWNLRTDDGNLTKYCVAYSRLNLLLSRRNDPDVPLYSDMYAKGDAGITIIRNMCEFFYGLLVKSGKEKHIPNAYKDYSIFLRNGNEHTNV